MRTAGYERLASRRRAPGKRNGSPAPAAASRDDEQPRVREEIPREVRPHEEARGDHGRERTRTIHQSRPRKPSRAAPALARRLERDPGRAVQCERRDAE